MSGLDPDVARLLEGMRRNNTPALCSQPVAAARRIYDKGLRLLDLAPDASVTAHDEALSGGLVMRAYLPAAGASGAAGAVLWLHGGGYCVGSLETSDIVCRMLAARCGCSVFSAGYRLAPEHPFPAAVDDALAAYRWSLARLGEPTARVAVAGDSAGATLAAVVSLLAPERGLPAPAAQLLIYPSALGCRPSASKQRYAEGHFLTLADIDWFYRHYTQGRALDDDPRFAPIAARSLRAQPPSLVIAAECDPLADDAAAYAAALKDAGNEVAFQAFAGMIHGFFNMGGVVPGARAAHALATGFLARALAAAA